jgi:hypothetical protein
MVIKTYSEVEGKEAFDWNKALSAKVISIKTWDELRHKAGDWVTCACGNQCAIIPRSSDTGRPLDELLATLGGGGGDGGFYGAIVRRDKEEALHLLKLIELRSAYLIKELSK